MTDFVISIPDEEVDTFVIRRMGKGDFVVTVSHKFGSTLDAHGQILGPVAPHGTAIDWDLSKAVSRAIAHMREEVRVQQEKQSTRPPAARSSGIQPPLNLNLDLDL